MDDEQQDELERYLGYISSALMAADDWRTHARAFLVSLGENPDELEREWVEDEGSLQQELDPTRAQQPAPEPEQPQEPVGQGSIPPPPVSVNFAGRVESIGREIDEWLRSGASISPDPLRQTAADQVREMVLRSALTPLQIGVLSTAIGPLAGLFEREPAPSELYVSICARSSDGSEGPFIGYTLPDVTALLRPWGQPGFKSTDAPLEWSEMTVELSSGSAYAASSAISYWLKYFWQKKHPDQADEMKQFVEDATLLIAALAESKAPVEKAAELRKQVGLTMFEKHQARVWEFQQARSSDLYEDYTWEQYFGKDDE